MAEQQEIGTHVNRGLAWVGTASSLVGVLDFVGLLLILGFWIPAEQYGIATKAVWIFPILDQATDLGLSGAVIQRDQHDDETISTVFWINLTIALFLFGVLAIGAPILATGFYGHAIVGWMLIAYGTKLIWQNLYFIPASLMKKELRFKELSVIRIIANLAEFVGKVGSAALGAGIWCFVIGPLCRVFVTGIGCQLRHPWRPKFVLKLKKAWSYATFGIKTSGSQILFYFYTNVDYPIVGYYFGDAALGIYRLAYEIVLEPVRVISYVVVDIAFPVFARLRHARDKMITQFISLTRLNLVTVTLYSAIVFVTAGDLATLFFPKYPSDQIVDAVRILCGVAMLRSVSFIIPPLLDGAGYPSRTLVYTITAAITLPIAYVLGAIFLGVRGPHLGFQSVAIAWAIGYPIAFAVLLMLAVYTLDIPARRLLR
jgi:O-antigen/teichoic acid export membrane protein